MLYLQLKKVQTLSLLGVLCLVGCQPQENVVSHRDEKSLKTFDQLINEETTSGQKKQILEGLQALRSHNFELASQIFNNLLTNDPTNSGLHTLNALTYQLRGKNGDFASFDLAEAGYQQAKKFNPNNVYASLQLGRVKEHKKDYLGAQEEFAEVLLYDPYNEEALYELASASYLMGDIKTARMSIDILLKENQQQPEYVRAGALIHAVQGDREKANKLLAIYNKIEKKQKNKAYLSRRVNDWFRLHDNGNIVMADSSEPSVVKTQALSIGSKTSTVGKGIMIAESPSLGVQIPPTMTSSMDAMGETNPNLPEFAEPQGGMVVMDAIILRVIDQGETSKGQNILENFTLTLSPFTKYYARNAGSAITGANIFPLNNISTGSTGTNASTSTNIPGLVSSVAPNLNDRVSLVAGGISFGTLNYSLNIANVMKTHIEIIGRPTLTSHVGKSSEFFNGEQLNIALSSTFGGGNLNQVPTGLTLRVTPTAIQDDYVALSIQFIDSFLKETQQQIVASILPNSPLVFSTTNSEVKTTVKAKLGDTIVLGGTIERHDVASTSGFPFLKDLPFIQYFFSQEQTVTTRTSVLFLLTPRSFGAYKNAAKQYLASKSDEDKRPNLTELGRRHKDWFFPQSNVLPILQTFGPMYQDFRLGDIMNYDWTCPPAFDKQLYNLWDFLWD